MNTLDVVYEMYTEANPDGYQPIPHGYRIVLKVLELRQKQCSDENIGLVRMQGKDKEIVPAVRKYLQELLETRVIRKSESPFSVVVRKQNGQVCLCVDYCKLNLQTVKDAVLSRDLWKSQFFWMI